jgi:hypothetical protein
MRADRRINSFNASNPPTSKSQAPHVLTSSTQATPHLREVWPYVERGHVALRCPLQVVLLLMQHSQVVPGLCTAGVEVRCQLVAKHGAFNLRCL